MKKAGCEKIFQEKASGAQRDRPALKAALTFMRKGDVLVIWKFDRLARSLRQLIDTMGDLKAEGMGLLSLTEAIDTSTTAGKLTFHIFAALAEFERDVIRDRTMAGLAAARAEDAKAEGRRQIETKDLAAAKAMLRDPDITVKESLAG